MVTETIARGAAVSISHLHHAFTLGKQTVPVLENISLQLRPGESVALLGPSGCGKSTLLRLLAGLEAPQSGQMQIDGAALGAPGPERILVFQDPTLYPWLTVRQNVLLGPQAQGKRGLEAKADALIDRIGLQAFSEAWPRQLSGGMAQRAALARTLYEDRPIVLMDEPFSALDTLTRTRIQTLAATLLAGRTVVLITHDPQEACRLSHRLLVLSAADGDIDDSHHLAGTPPRAPDAPDLLIGQAALLQQLMRAQP